MPLEQKFSEVEYALQEEHFSRYVEFMKLTVSLSFGGLMFLLAFEKDYLTPQHHSGWLVHTAWFLMLGASLLGIALLAMWVNGPIRRLRAAHIESHPTAPRGRVVRIPGDSPAIERWCYWLHATTFAAAILALALYKALNL